MTAQSARVFLGWDGPALPRVADWLVGHAAELGGDLASVIVALPGRRAARRLEQHLARRLPRGAAPPRLVSVGYLPDELLVAERPFGGRLLRTLLWRDALRGLPVARRELLLRHAPDADDEDGWLALAEEVRTLHAELVAEGSSFEAVARAARPLGGEPEALRWAVLAEVRDAFLRSLRAQGFDDPHESRRGALAAGALVPGVRVVLAGVADPNALVRELLAGLGPRATSLVIAPVELASAFDELGALRTPAWTARPIELPEGTWRLVDRPDDQAAAAVEWIAERGARLRPDEIVLGVPEPEVVPHLQRRLRERGATARPAEGHPLPRTAPVRLLAGLQAHLDAPAFATSAALLRHPDLLAALRAREPQLGEDLPARLDDYHADHLPDALLEDWPGLHGSPRQQADARAVQAAHRALGGLLSELRGERPARDWSAPLAELLRALWGERELDEARPDERRLAGALRRLGAALDELAALPAEVGPRLDAAEALRLLLRSVERESVPEPADPEAIELLGWLELALDDAPAVVVTGLNEGRVPGAVRGHALLPDGLRRELGLPDDARRLARDAYALQLVVRARRDVLILTGRRNQDDDALRPSRLLFLAPDEVAIARAREFGRRDEGSSRVEILPTPAPRALPSLAAPEPVTTVSVTDFSVFLQSPYRFWLERALHLERAEDSARELDPSAFGKLAHDVLAGLIEDEPARLRDEAVLARWLRARLAEKLHERYGQRPPPAVALQAEHLGWRLDGFAAWQAEQQRQGWRVARAEWPGQMSFVVEGGELALRGRIDRIDVGPGGRWRVIDYKTGDGGEPPKTTHGPGRDGRWRDLQLPLYLLLAEPLRAELGAQGDAQAGYVVLPRERPEGDDWWLPGEWDANQLSAALQQAREAGAAILRGDFQRVERWDPDDEVFAAILGQGLLTSTEGAAEENA